MVTMNVRSQEIVCSLFCLGFLLFVCFCLFGFFLDLGNTKALIRNQLFGSNCFCVCFSRAGVCCTVCRVHAEQERGEAVQSVQKRLPHGHERVAAQVSVQARGNRAPDLWKQSEICFCLFLFTTRLIMLIRILI